MAWAPSQSSSNGLEYPNGNEIYFPDSLPTAPLIKISHAKFLAKDASEQNRFLETLKGPGFSYLHLADTPEGKRLLSTVEELFSLSRDIFALPQEERERWRQDFDSPYPWTGLRHRGAGVADDKGTRDWSQFMNVGKTEILDESKAMPLPDLLNQHRKLLRSFTEQAHAVLITLLESINDALGLPPGTLPSMHRFEAKGTDQMRFTYAKREDSSEQLADSGAGESTKANGLSDIALPGHRDASTITILFNKQAGLQILPPEEAQKSPMEQKWPYVKPLPGHAIINIGDAMVTYTNGLLRSTPHRVVAPPGAYPGVERYSIVYFMRPGDEEVLRRLEGSDLIPPLKAGQNGEDDGMTGAEWVKKRFRKIQANRGIIRDEKHR